VNIDELISKIWHWMVLRLLCVLFATLLGKLTGPLSDWLVAQAARRVPSKYREDFEKQCLADFYSLRPWLRLKSALGVLVASRAYSRIADEQNVVLDLDALNSDRPISENSNRDGLTGLKNRRSFQKSLSRRISRAKQLKRELCVIMVDIDNFRPVNNRCGHSAGDRLLRELARRLQARLRPADLIARYGGDEFLVVLPNTCLKRAKEIAEQLRAACEVTVKGSKFMKSKIETFRITASFGVASRSANTEMYDLLSNADSALYLAKAAGRNLVREYTSQV
jgi:diguanylate cyclase (GGDEF)-like protein